MTSTICTTSTPEKRLAAEDAAVVGSHDDLTLELKPASERTAIEPLWRQLEQRLDNHSLACSWGWTATWLDHYGDLVPHRFVVSRSRDRVCGVALLTQGVDQKDGPFTIRSLHIGTAGEPECDSVCVEHNRILVEDGFAAEFFEQLIELVESESDWDELRLDGIAGDTADEIIAHCRQFERRAVECCYFDLAAARAASSQAIQLLGYSTRKNIRKNVKRYGDLTAEWAESVEQAELIFDDLVRLHQARWNAAGEPGCYASRRFTAFHRDLIRRLVPSGKVVLFRVCDGDEVVGCVQLLVDGRRALCYQGGSAPYVGKQSPGMIVDYLCIEECLRRGFDAYDFLGGDSHHKRKLSTHATQMIWATWRRPRLKYSLLRAGRRLRQAAAPITHRRTAKTDRPR